ncbi:hypothetical protein [Bifidobacterium panos]|uniref:Uncharacterized protein n=1 Tax=Bifidobacterium panos TaxID=2675321 RepID=A0ABX1SZS0_9BIFI|nr:hypothetical protein [Bifidobacterium sp. DSM 109963]NMN02784.1 hypothetical protein [Bifidobacterium sp. DSM 109963]
MADVHVPIEKADLSIRESLDAEGLVSGMFDMVDFKSAGFDDVDVQAEVAVDTDSMAFDHCVILWHCSAPYQPDLHVKAWIWRFTLSLTVMGHDPKKVRDLCAFIDRTIAAWPYADPTGFGKVGLILDNPGFSRVSTADVATSKTVVVRSSTKLIQAGSPRT